VALDTFKPNAPRASALAKSAAVTLVAELRIALVRFASRKLAPVSVADEKLVFARLCPSKIPPVRSLPSSPGSYHVAFGALPESSHPGMITVRLELLDVAIISDQWPA
jgi:hypothetical protein